MSGKRSLPSIWASRGALFAALAAGLLGLCAAAGAWLLFAPPDDDPPTTAGRNPRPAATPAEPPGLGEAERDVLVRAVEQRPVPSRPTPAPLTVGVVTAPGRPPPRPRAGPPVPESRPGRAVGHGDPPGAGHPVTPDRGRGCLGRGAPAEPGKRSHAHPPPCVGPHGTPPGLAHKPTHKPEGKSKDNPGHAKPGRTGRPS